MRRRSFLFAAAAAVFPVRKSFGQTSLGTLTWAQPDGLWIRELPDGPAKKVVSGGRLSSPRFSPSGSWISYKDREGKLFVVDTDSSGGAPVPGENRVWLGGQDRLATQTDGDVTVFAPENEWKTPLARWNDAGLPLASPEGDRFVATRAPNHADQNDVDQRVAQLYTASFVDPDHVEVLLSNEGDIQPWGWTRDGKSIVYWRADEWSASLWADDVDLYSMSLSGGLERKLGVSALAHDEMLDLAPKSAGNAIAVARSGGRETWSRQNIVIVDSDTGSSRDLTPAATAALWPAWSPDGRTVACFAAPDADAAYKKAMAGVNIRVMRPDGSVTTQLVTPASNVSAVGGGEEAHAYLQQRKIWFLDPNGVNPPRQITSDPKYRDEAPLWSADGSHLLFGRMDYDGHASLWLMESNGANLKQICPLKIYDSLLDKDSWFGFYGYTDWRSAFDWRRI